MPLKAYQAVPESLRSISPKFNGSAVAPRSALFASCLGAHDLSGRIGMLVWFSQSLVGARDSDS